MQSLIENKQNQSTIAARTLHTVSPLATLGRGYSIVQQRNTNCIIRSHTDVQPDDGIKVKLNDGQLLCKVTKTLSE